MDYIRFLPTTLEGDIINAIIQSIERIAADGSSRYKEYPIRGYDIPYKMKLDSYNIYTIIGINKESEAFKDKLVKMEKTAFPTKSESNIRITDIMESLDFYKGYINKKRSPALSLVLKELINEHNAVANDPYSISNCLREYHRITGKDFIKNIKDRLHYFDDLAFTKEELKLLRYSIKYEKGEY